MLVPRKQLLTARFKPGGRAIVLLSRNGSFTESIHIAFPDDLTLWVRKLQGRLVDKHDRDSPEGRALRALREIRIQASPSWETDAVAIMFFFIRRDDDFDFEGADWQNLLDAWLKLLPANTRFTAHGQISTLDELTASDYVHSDP